MNPRIAANQQRTFLGLLDAVLPHLASDPSLPRRIKELLGRNRSLGSRDRRLYRELIYTTLRYLPWVRPLLEEKPAEAAQLIAWLAPVTRDTEAYRTALLADWPFVPGSVAEKAAVLTKKFGATFDAQALLPEWFRAHCAAAFAAPHLDVLLSRAPIWVRLQTADVPAVLADFQQRGWSPQPAESLPDAWALPPNADVAATDSYAAGRVEIQDLGSQLILHHAPVAAGQTWLDACAGAGGKTLQLAAMVGPTGRVDATDPRPEALEELRVRGERAQLSNVRVQRETGPVYDGVLVDAPCSGSGTWRRAPHLKWYTQPAAIELAAAQQIQILSESASGVKPGGLLVYATCSLSRVENHDVVQIFLAKNPSFKAEPPVRDWGGTFDGLGTTLLPGARNTDGFYVAVLRR
jgi:16S rRNA (cytosine967-C5)-methyltransferase